MRTKSFNFRLGTDTGGFGGFGFFFFKIRVPLTCQLFVKQLAK